MTLDEKQKRLIHAWLERASLSTEDDYFRFIAAWIAFNAFCYALFAKEASRERPNLSDRRGLNGLTGTVSTTGSIKLLPNNGVRIELDQPGRIVIKIDERYAEDQIYKEFGRAFGSAFSLWLQEELFSRVHSAFLEGLKRERGHFVINMLKVSAYNEETTLKELDETMLKALDDRNIVASVTNPTDLKQLVDVLYQIRCNIFHGEKVPGDINDDRYVRAAWPFLVTLLEHAIAAPGVTDC